MPRARVALAAAVAAACALAAAGTTALNACRLGDEYSSGLGQDSSALPLDAGTDASLPPGSDDAMPFDANLPDPAPITDADMPEALADGAAPDPGPWEDYCLGVPSILEPTEGKKVGLSFTVQVSAPGCIRTMLVYLDGSKSPVINGSSYDGVMTAPHPGSFVINVNAWDNTNNPHESAKVTFTAEAD